jgi:hypothetical protein
MSPDHIATGNQRLKTREIPFNPLFMSLRFRAVNPTDMEPAMAWDHILQMSLIRTPFRTTLCQQIRAWGLGLLTVSIDVTALF